MKLVQILAIIVIGLLSLQAQADISPAALELQQQWDQANFASADNKHKAEALKALAEKARQTASQNPDDAAVQAWTGIVLATYAGEAGLSALSVVKEARVHLEASIKLDPDAMAGSAYTTLGSLYYQVPGWPLSFGDDDQAVDFLKKGLERDPDGFDSNYFYGDYLLQHKQYSESATYFEKVLRAPARAGRELADQGKRTQASKALEIIKQKSAH